MTERLAALSLVLDHLEIPSTINSVNERMSLQKAVYLVQNAGISLGYSYGWYLKGPYSPTLTRDYYELAASGSIELGGVELKESVKNLLKPVKDLIASKPENLAMPRWLELLASILYLRNESRFSDQTIREKISETKPHLVAHLDDGFAAIQ